MCAQASRQACLSAHRARASLQRLDVSLAANDIGGTKRIELGTNMLLLPLHHPLRVAEDAAMVDVMSGGRLRLGVSAGYSPADLQAFGVPPDVRARRMREGPLLIRAVLGGEPEASTPSFAGCATSRSSQADPPAAIYIGGSVDAAIRRGGSPSAMNWSSARHSGSPTSHVCSPSMRSAARDGPGAQGEDSDDRPGRPCSA